MPSFQEEQINTLRKQGVLEENNAAQKSWLEAQDAQRLFELIALGKKLGLDSKSAVNALTKTTPSPQQVQQQQPQPRPASRTTDMADMKHGNPQPQQVVKADSQPKSMQTFMKGFVSMMEKSDMKFGQDIKMDCREMDGKKYLIISGDKANDPAVKTFLDDMKSKGVVKEASADEMKKLQGLSSSQPAQKTQATAAPASATRATAAAAAPSPLQTTPKRR